MNKYLLMTAAALAAASATMATDASAKGGSGTATMQLLTSGGYYSYCDVYHAGWNGAESAGSDDLTGCYENFQSKGTGSIGKIKGEGKVMTNGDDQFAYYYGPGNYGLSFQFVPSPSATTTGTGAAQLWYSSTCCSSTLLNTAEYVITGPGVHHPVKNHTSLVKGLIAAGKVKSHKN